MYEDSVDKKIMKKKKRGTEKSFYGLEDLLKTVRSSDKRFH